jgi:transposase
MKVRRVSLMHECIFVHIRAYSLDLRKKIVESVKKGLPKAETARRFGVDRATLKRYCKRLDERGTLQSSKAPARNRSSTRRPERYSRKTSKRAHGPPTPRGRSSFMPRAGFR